MADSSKKTNKKIIRRLRRSEEDSLHLIEFSQGKPNEISFNVLGNLAADSKEKRRRSFFRRSSQSDADVPTTVVEAMSSSPHAAGAFSDQAETYPSGSVSAPKKKKRKRIKPQDGAHTHAHANPSPTFLQVEAQDEIKRRQRARRVARITSIAVILVVVGVLCVMGATYAIKEYERVQSNQALIKTSCEYLASSDQIMVPIDTFFSQPFDDETIARADELAATIPDGLTNLDSAQHYADIAQGNIENTSLESPRDKQALDHVLNAITARRTLFDLAEQRLLFDKNAKQTFDNIAQAQDVITEGNSLMAEAAKVVGDTTPEHVEAANTYLESARASFMQAKEKIQAAKELSPQAALDALSVYCDKRIEAIGYALESDAAILIQDKKTAEAFNAQYNQADQEATTLAASFPEELTQIIVDYYEKEGATLVEHYDAVRNDVAVADAFLRDYLGVGTQE